MAMLTMLYSILLPIEINTQGIDRGIIRLEKLDGTLITKDKFKTGNSILKINLKIKDKIYDPFLYRVVLKGNKKKVVRSLAYVSPFPLITFDPPSMIEGDTKLPLRITLAPISIPLQSNYRYILTLKDENDKVLYKEENKTKKENITNLTIPIPAVKKDLSATITLTIENDYYFTTLEKDISIVPKEIQTFLITDKPIYQPSQEIHIRTLSLYLYDKQPVRNSTFVFKILDPSSNVVMQKNVKSNNFGIGYTNFRLADQVNTGTYKIEIFNKEKKIAEKSIKVEKYVLPKYDITLKTDKEFYSPSEKITGTVESKYFFGKPVSDANVKIVFKKYEVYFEEIGTIEGKTDKNGIFKFSFKLPDYFAGIELEKGSAPLFIDVMVEDKTEHTEEKSFDKKIVINPVDIEAVPLGGKLIKGVKTKVLISISYPDGTPASGELIIEGKKINKTIKVPQNGFTYFYLKPGNNVSLKLTFKSKQLSYSKEFSFDVKDKTGDFVFISLPEIRGKAGKNFEVNFFSSTDIKTVYFDIVKNKQTYLKKTIKMENGEGYFSFDVDNLLTGTVFLTAYGITKDGKIIRDRKVVYFEPADELNIDVVYKKTGYLPGERANITFIVKDKQGKPKVSALGIAVVDEAVFSLSELHPGLEKVFFEIEKELLKPRYEIHGLKWNIVIGQRRKNAMDMLLSFVSNELDVEFENPVLSVNNENLHNLFKPFFDKLLKKVRNAVSNHWSEIVNMGQEEEKDITSFMLKKGLLRKQDLTDPWNTPVKIITDFWSVYIVSAGPDQKFKTSDDLKYNAFEEMPVMGFEEDMIREAVPMKKSAVAELPIREKPLDGGKKKNGGEGNGEETHVRNYFPETFLFEPSLITNEKGEAKIEVRMPDAITTYRMTIFASSEGGLLGSTEEGIKIFKDFFIEPDIPLNFVRGDEVYLRTGIYNYTDKTLSVRLNITTDEKVELKKDKFRVKVNPQDVKGVYIPVKFVKSGRAKIKIEGEANGKKDIVEKIITIVPPGLKKEISKSGVLREKEIFNIDYPVGIDPEGRETFIRIYPGALSQVLSGLENLLRVPYGCFEQTSSVTYPNILILNYIRTRDMDMPDIDMKATEYINLGYQRLLSFEVEGGGFSWFGNYPANKILTAYGLREFKDMSKVYPIDEKVIDRTLNWLLSKQNRDGSFNPDKQAIDEEVTIGLRESPLLPTAYITWSLKYIGYHGKQIKKAENYLEKHINELKDPYELALFLNAFVGNEQNFNKVWLKLKENMIVEKDKIHWESKKPGGYFGNGISKNIETTAMIASALLTTKTELKTVGKIINYLYSVRNSDGAWYSTQPTVLALKVITDYSLYQGDVSGKIIIKTGEKTEEKEINKDNKELIVVKIPLNTKQVEVQFKGTGSPVYDFVTSYYVKNYPERNKKDILSIDLKYDKHTLKVNDLVGVTLKVRTLKGAVAEMVIVDLGIPPGFSPITYEWDELVNRGIIKKYEFTGRQIIVYFDKLTEKEVKIEYHLKANFPLKISGAGAKIYKYYEPENTGYTKPVPVEVKE